MPTRATRTKSPNPATPDDPFGPKFRLARERAGLTQEFVAESMRRRGFELQQSTVYKIENGHRRVTVQEGIELARIVGSTVEELAHSDRPSGSKLQVELDALSKQILQNLVLIEPVLAEIEAAARLLDSRLTANTGHDYDEATQGELGIYLFLRDSIPRIGLRRLRQLFESLAIQRQIQRLGVSTSAVIDHDKGK